MERSRAIAEASSSREAAAYDYASLPGYRSSFSSYNQQVSLDRQPITSDGRGAYNADHHSELQNKVQSKEPLGSAGDGIYGEYSYTSSYDDLSRRYGYGSDGGSNLSEAYKGSTFGGTSVYHRDSSYMSSASPRTSGFSQDVGSTYGSRHHSYADEQWISNRYDSDLGSQKSFLDSRGKPDAMSYESSAVGGHGNFDYKFSYPRKDYNVCPEQSNSGYYTLTEGNMSGATRDEKSSYLPASKYETTPSGSYLPSAGASYDWKSAAGIQRASAELGWKGFHSLSSFRHEENILDRGESSSRFMDDDAYPESRGYSKLRTWNEALGRQAELESGQKGYTEPAANGSKVADTKEALIPVQGVGLPKPANEVKKRQSRWGPVEENKKDGEDGIEKPKKKTRWSAEKSPVKEINLPNIMKELPADSSDIVALKARLIIINKMLQSGHMLDNLNTERSPSPEPIFDNFGFRINTREHRTREKLNKERQKIVAKLTKNQTPSKPVDEKPTKVSVHGKPSKVSKKIYIPVDKHPDYNFIGLIIGPRGNTQKKMEKESGARIFIRGKGSAKEGVSSTNANAPPDDDDNLHVLVEADSEDAINKASEMVEKILVPLKDGNNELKRAQLRELASMNGTLRVGNDVICLECKQPGHIAKDCANFLKGGSKMGVKPASRVVDSSSNDEINNTHLYVANLPASVDDAQLLGMFSPFGRILSGKVMTHPTTGISKCYGSVKFVEAGDAAQAAALMNGYQVDGKVLTVKIKMKSDPAS